MPTTLVHARRCSAASPRLFVRRCSGKESGGEPFRIFLSGGCFPRESHVIQSGTVDVFGVKDSYFDFSILRYFLRFDFRKFGLPRSILLTIARASNQPNPLSPPPCPSRPPPSRRTSSPTPRRRRSSRITSESRAASPQLPPSLFSRPDEPTRFGRSLPQNAS